METNTNTSRRLISTAEAARRAGTSLRAVRLACERVPDLAVRLYPTARWKIDAAVLDRVLHPAVPGAAQTSNLSAAA